MLVGKSILSCRNNIVGLCFVCFEERKDHNIFVRFFLLSVVLLFTVHVGIGRLKRLGQGGGLLRGAYAQRQPHWNLRTGIRVRVGDLPDALHQGFGGVGVGQGQEYGKLIPADTRDHILAAKGFRQNLSRLFEQGITGGMPGPIIDLFESIDISHQNTNRIASSVFEAGEFLLKKATII